MNPKDSLLEQLYQQSLNQMVKDPKTPEEVRMNNDIITLFLSVAPQAAMHDAAMKLIESEASIPPSEIELWRRVLSPMHCILFGIFLGFVAAILLRYF